MKYTKKIIFVICCLIIAFCIVGCHEGQIDPNSSFGQALMDVNSGLNTVISSANDVLPKVQVLTPLIPYGELVSYVISGIMIAISTLIKYRSKQLKTTSAIVVNAIEEISKSKELTPAVEKVKSIVANELSKVGLYDIGKALMTNLKSK